MTETPAPNATVAWLRRIHDQLLILRVRPDGPLPSSQPGQHTMLGFYGGEKSLPEDTRPPEEPIRRIFSLSSSILDDGGESLLDPARVDYHEFYIALDSTALAQRADRLAVGVRLWMSPQIRGSYILGSPAQDDSVVLCATGTGEAPHNRMIEELLRRQHRGRIVSVICCRRREDLGYDRLHRRLVELFPGYGYLPVTTRDLPGPRRHIQDLLLSGDLQREAGIPLDPKRTHVFLCGNAGMVGRPREVEGKTVYPDEPGMVELLETRFGFRVDSPGRQGNIQFERCG
jgi:ferredoxin--NADP+ reductase